MLITRSDDGYFGLRQSLEVAFGEEVSLHFGVQRALLDRGRLSSGTKIWNSNHVPLLWTSSRAEVDLMSQVSGILPK